MRSEFEKLPEIAELIDEHEAFYCEKGDWYLCPDDQFAESYLDGALYAYQEQQKRIDAMRGEIESLISKYSQMLDPHNNDVNALAVDVCLDLKELLK